MYIPQLVSQKIIDRCNELYIEKKNVSQHINDDHHHPPTASEISGVPTDSLQGKNEQGDSYGQGGAIPDSGRPSGIPHGVFEWEVGGFRYIDVSNDKEEDTRNIVRSSKEDA